MNPNRIAVIGFDYNLVNLLLGPSVFGMASTPKGSASTMQRDTRRNEPSSWMMSGRSRGASSMPVLARQLLTALPINGRRPANPYK